MPEGAASLDAQIAHLCGTIDSARREIAGLEAKRDESVSNGSELHVATASEARSYGIAVGSDDSAENNARRARIAFLQAHIADCDRQIQILSDAIAGSGNELGCMCRAPGEVRSF